MMELGQRAPTTVRLLGSSASTKAWREALIREGLPVPVSGRALVALVDIRNESRPLAAINDARSRAEGVPIVAVIAPTDPIPRGLASDIVLFRLFPGSLGGLVRALKIAAHRASLVRAAAVRFEALAKMGHLMDGLEPEPDPGPCVLLAQPAPEILPMIQGTSRRQLVGALSSGQTLRMLEAGQASALLLNVGDQRELRIPVLKLIRRQSDLSDIPVAVLSNEWSDETAQHWLTAGADLLARPEEVVEVLDVLDAASTRFRTVRTLRNALACATLTENGEPSQAINYDRFMAILEEHRRRGDEMAYGLIEISSDDPASENDIAEAGVYMSMAISPAELIHRPRPNLYFVAMPFADRFYARRTMRTMQTLIEDLKFGEEPSPVLLTARQVSCVAGDEPPPETFARLHTELVATRKATIIA